MFENLYMYIYTYLHTDVAIKKPKKHVTFAYLNKLEIIVMCYIITNYLFSHQGINLPSMTRLVRRENS